MQALAPEYYYTVEKLLNDGFQHPEVLSIIERNNPGAIYVDQLLNPRSALVWSQGIQGFYLIGDYRNDYFNQSLDGFIAEYIEPRMKATSLTHLEISGHHEKWDFESMFASRKLYQFEQLVLEMRKEPVETIENTGTYQIINLKTDEWNNGSIRNVELINSHIDLFWSSKEEFKKKGYGYAALDESEVIGVCYSSFVTNQTHAIGIETVPRYQNKGVGTYLGYRLVKDIRDSGYTPYWDCSLDNEASKRLACRLGFEQVHRYKCRGFEIEVVEQ
ncbi:GNAT family N-acetyltransferase [Paenibacillus sp. alder61]|uniref:GNAT family N-acetyltransferase n=1 Tax=Paenibacillus faecis TaxID=862114 RepID=A0A5D0D192_9BACL|nr:MULTISPECIES: GNAT family N-acetyltransferase [Paenibacillus]MCA1295423.1 GNAT family N-acetyltransferase [Paenibacillus sp. alder61]TYA14505.1 GNAT family N-acetyltransferase [Paenibacillus faecis]